MSEQNEEKIINILTDISLEMKKQTAELADLKNLFLRYDLEAQAEQMEEFIED
jgi:hypothetical protein